MSYRSFKRALGETNIERKCRILFGLCFGILVCGAFFWIDRITTGLVELTAVQTSRGYAAVELLNIHWKWFSRGEADEYADRIRDDLLMNELQIDVLSLDGDDVTRLDAAEVLTQDERTLLEDLREEWLKKQEELDSRNNVGLVPPALSDTTVSGELPTSNLAMNDFNADQDWAFGEGRVTPDGQYTYYQPVLWTARCELCHRKSGLEGTFSRADTALTEFRTGRSYRVVRVTMPYEEPKRVITYTRSILIATAILMIFLVMVALYLIVRYVIVKPLKHLSDVSEEVSRGNRQLRADIQTNDEFEELADSFNRMLQHLTDAQDELTNVNSDLDAKVDELAQLNMRLYEMNRLKSDFLANMSHELRTPLNSIIGFSEVLQGIESLTDKQKRYAHNIQKSGRVLLEMINDILDLAKLEAGKMELRPTEFRIDVVVNAQCDMVRPLCEDKNIDLDVRVRDSETPVYQDQSKVQQILTNLLSNAIKFTPDGGRILVTSERTRDGQLRLSVADTGVGIPDEDREIIFEKFRQSKEVLANDGLTREFSGTGLGLSIVKELCKLVGGETTFESELGKGSTFSVTVPWALNEGTGIGKPVGQQAGTLDTSHPAPHAAKRPLSIGDA